MYASFKKSGKTFIPRKKLIFTATLWKIKVQWQPTYFQFHFVMSIEKTHTCRKVFLHANFVQQLYLPAFFSVLHYYQLQRGKQVRFFVQPSKQLDYTPFLLSQQMQITPTNTNSVCKKCIKHSRFSKSCFLIKQH